ncbi:antiviral RADAR system adenosine deaminase RdrB [Shewanella sp. GutDb-MelDb]|uniref:antiviral RADAR system adenosine deaminase RdrB n=1 Tax=Shewanella sp. GutDb-MelDb TaxID=2058316 RepID=UPI000C7A7547|nr:antiviral RADAR system adenosine deaminase RdrB [Shewanella sp. GutDb-MelDb]PKG58104.1 hypothetical protein CXF82_06175 [Shewanella sp. GutDb-MelDb]
MLTIDIHWLVPCVLVGSDRFIADNQGLTYVDEGLIKLAIRDYQHYLAAPLRNEDIAYAINEWRDADGNLCVIHILKKIEQYFLIWHGDRFEVNPESLDEWLALIAMLDPAWVLGLAYAQLMQDGVIGVEQLTTIFQTQCPSALPKRFDGLDIADNHVHLGGHGHNSLSLLDFCLYLTKNPNISADNWPYRSEYSLFNSGQLDVTLLPIATNLSFSLLFDELYNLKGGCLFPPWNELEMAQFSVQNLVTLEVTSRGKVTQQLIRASHLSNVPSSIRWTLLTTAMMHAQLGQKELSQEKVNQFVRLSNILRNYMIVSGVGLGQFVEYFGFKLRKPQSGCLSYQEHGLMHDLGAHVSREFRGASNLVLKEHKKSWILKPKKLAGFAQQLLANKLESQCHFVIHFTRDFSKTAAKGDYLLTHYREDLLTQLRKIQDFYSSLTYQCYQLNDNDKLASVQTEADLRALVRGFDVAGNENELPIEVFAPTLRVLRSSKQQAQSIYEKRLRRPFLTVHSGEDYSHILSGLRAIDEAVIFCGFESGDRLGHALALGVDVSVWAKRQQRIYLSPEAHLDNLVWCYQKGVSISMHNPIFNGVLSVLAQKISRLVRHIYGNVQHYSTEDLYKAWELRRNCPLMVDRYCTSTSEEVVLWAPDTDFIHKCSNSKPVILWRQRMKSDSSNEKAKVISISCSATNLHHDSDDIFHDFISPQEIELIEAIQDWQIEQYSKKQIIIEACPTSNVFISRINCYSEHPIYRWCPPTSKWLEAGGKFNKFGIRTGAIKVCVNTDDAGLMPTSIENEHRVLQHTAIKHFNISDFEAHDWIVKIREAGVSVFRTNHIDWS